jgi:hypothetical protein
MSDFACKVIRSWDDFNDSVCKMASPSGQWLYRGQPQDWQLMTTLERALVGWGIPLADATSIEFQTMREFRRRLRQPEYDRVQEDTLHCLALMQHYRAPTRLLDCTYSPFVAVAFAMENGICPLRKTDPRPRPVVWCFYGRWCEEQAKSKLPLHKRTLIGRRNNDAQRNDKTFLPLFQIKSSRVTGVPKWKFVKE